MTNTTILFQGDSITDCGRAACGGAGFDSKGLGPGYPGMIAARLACDRPGVEWDFINRGISGNRVVDLYARWKIDTLHLEPDLLSILIGVNDSLHEGARGNGVEPERYERFYRELLSWTRRELPSCRFVLVEPFLIEPDEEKKGLSGGNCRTRQDCPEACGRFQCRADSRSGTFCRCCETGARTSLVR